MPEQTTVPKRRGRPPKVRPLSETPTIQRQATADEQLRDLMETAEEDAKTLTGAPEPSVQASTANVDRAQLAAMPTTVPTVFLTEDRIVNIHAPIPLVTFHLRRVENELTDTMRTVHIPSPAIVKDGERVVIHVYREE
jgi:hypothetical protein